MDNILQVTLLYDFYGELLTVRQKNIFELYYQYDLTLAEIAKECNISPQAVSDSLKRTQNILYKYEVKLQCLDKYIKLNNKIQNIISEIDDMFIYVKNKEKLISIKNQLNDILNV